MDWLIEPFQLEFMQRSLWAGLLAVVTTSVVGTWVVLRGLSFLGDALAHGVLPGIALAVLFGFNPALGAALSAAAMVGGIDLVHRRSRLSEDTGIGLLFVGMLALGVVIVSRAPSSSGNLTDILFGDALGATTGDITVLAIAATVAVVLSAAFYRPFLALSFDRDKAQVLGMHPRLAHLAMLALVTLAVVASFQTVGTLLVFGLMVAPPATAALLARRVPTMLGTAVALGALAVTGGLLLSYHAGTAASATMAGLSVAIFFAVLAGRGVGSRTVRI